MFLTSPQFEQFLPRALAPNGERCWRAMELSVHHHWFFVTVRERADDLVYRRSFLFGMDTDLLAMLRSDPPFEFLSIEIAMPPDDPGDGWIFEQVRSVWMARKAGSPRQDLLVFGTRDERLFEPLFNLDVPNLGKLQPLLQLD